MILTSNAAAGETAGLTLPADGLSSEALSSALRRHTQRLHTRAERSGIVRDLLRGQARLAGYALLLRNLLGVYQTIEDRLAVHLADARLGAFARPELARAAAIRADLAQLAGVPHAAPLLPAGRRYAARVAAADVNRLIAHAYVRYLGDLSGGQMLASLLTRRVGVPAEALAFYHFADSADPPALRAALRATLDALAGRGGDGAAVLAEAAVAFRLNIALAEAVQMAANDGSGSV